jgi:large subunit ribosomal protein L6
MSRIGKLPIEITDAVKANLEGRIVTITGPKGELSYKHRPSINIEIAEGKIIVSIKKITKTSAGYFGLTRTIINNMVKGVTEGFEKRLEFHGVGYRAAMEGKDLVMHLGFSHPVRYQPREGIEIKVEKNVITVNGIDKQLVGQTAAEIRDLKKPEPYKGKGIRYEGEHVRRKAGKTAAKASA